MRLSSLHAFWHQGAELRSALGDAGPRTVAIRARPTRVPTAAHASRLRTAGKNDLSWERQYCASELAPEIDCTTEHVKRGRFGLNQQGLGRRV